MIEFIQYIFQDELKFGIIWLITIFIGIIGAYRMSYYYDDDSPTETQHRYITGMIMYIIGIVGNILTVCSLI